MGRSGPWVSQMWVKVMTVQPASSQYHKDIKYPQKDEAVKHPLLQDNPFNVWRETVSVFSAFWLRWMPKAFCICVISLCQQMPGNICTAWQRLEKAQYENVCISNVASTFLLPDLKTNQLQWHQLQINKMHRSYCSPRLVMVAALLPSRSSAAACCQGRKHKPWHSCSPCALDGCSAHRGNWLILA